MNNLDHCFNLTGKIIVLKENETKFYVENDINQEILKVQVDDCIFTKVDKTKRCDWLLLILKPYTEIYIELKGSRITDAVEQLEETIKNENLRKFLQNRYYYSQPIKIICCIISSQTSNNKNTIKLREIFTSKYPKIVFRILSSNSDKRPQKLSNLVQ